MFFDQFLYGSNETSYQINKAMEAFQNGNLVGRGPGEGTVKLQIPDAHTDFIFAVVGEELGFIGAAFLLLLYLLLLWRGIRIAQEASDTFGMLLAVGITSMLVFHVLVNIGMTMGIMPVTGIPLPLMSYGISSLTTNIMSIAILLNVYMKKQRLVF